MRLKFSPKYLLVIPVLLVLAILMYNVPSIHSRLAWRLDNLRVRIQYAINPPEQAVFQPQEQAQLENQVNAIVEATLTAMAPTFTPTPLTPTPTPLGPTATLQPTSIPVTETASAVPFAPACAVGIAIPVPLVKETNKICIEKKPYTAISIPEGASFDPLDPSQLTCVKERSSDGKTLISCTGQELFSYDLKVCVPPVVSSADAGKCAEGELFESANQCCLAPPAEGAGCTIFKVDLRACE